MRNGQAVEYRVPVGLDADLKLTGIEEWLDPADRCALAAAFFGTDGDGQISGCDTDDR
ncbi:MAG TPA: hypothetical protein VLA56_16540 [Pseudomonadales bacterium]|nr:hypothetical protein [Pseudomonadales bacterium]